MTPTDIRILLESVLPFLLGLAALGTGGKIVTTWLRSRGGVRSEAELRAISEQLRQLQESVDTMAVEVERIEEAQRFNARLLAEGRSPQRPGAP